MQETLEYAVFLCCGHSAWSKCAWKCSNDKDMVVLDEAGMTNCHFNCYFWCMDY